MSKRFNTDLDSLVKRLRSQRVRRIVEPVLAGEGLPMEVLNDDLAFVKDLGLVRSAPRGLEIANPIYREIVPRAPRRSFQSLKVRGRARPRACHPLKVRG